MFMCARAFVIADGDVETKGDRVERFTTMLQDRFHLLPGKEIENLIPIGLLKAFAKTQLGDQFAWKDEESDLPPREWGVGAFLDQMTGKAGQFTKRGRSKGASEKSPNAATIRQKGPLCDFVVAQLKDPSTPWILPKEVKELCEKVFRHISQENGISLAKTYP